MSARLFLLFALGLLAACASHREPKANCFNFVTRGPVGDCSFTPLDGTAPQDDSRG